MNNLPLVDPLILNDLGYKSPPISIGRDSVTFFASSSGYSLVCKSYDPQKFNLAKLSEDSSTDSYLSKLGYKDHESRYYFNKEAKVFLASENLSDTNDQFTPKLIGVNPKTSTLYTERVPFVNFRDYYRNGNNRKKKTEEFVDYLVQFHGITGRHFKKLYNDVRWGNTVGLRPRLVKEEEKRFLDYLRVIVYRASDEFAEFLKSQTAKSQIANEIIKQSKITKKPRSKNLAINNVINNVIKCFVKDKKFDLEEFVREFIKIDRKIIYGNSEDFLSKKNNKRDEDIKTLLSLYNEGVVSIIHGDFNFQNVFHLPEELREKRKVLLCDPDEMRVAAREVDVVSAIYNIDNSPRGAGEEMAAFELLAGYVEGVNSEEGIRLDWNKFPVRCFETRLKECIRMFAVDCRMPLQKIKSFAEGLPHFEEIDEKSLQDKFLEEMFVKNFQHFSDYILGEGWGYIHNGSNANLLRKQVENVNDFFLKTGVVSEITAKAKRRGRFKNLEELARILMEKKS
ncbi:MAG: hypothetical protein ABH824_00645 [Nanoarchaeota archaeon]|nr:hypothetical protein [Nanoarchaeota archaeon]MBU1631576.1 hypothetical protein [Nanoarchaeota archaeon]MBU1875492.1 hypothetical protein [Nanoarchaeota archaeon]